MFHSTAPFESESESGSVVSDFLLPHGQYSPWNSPGQNARVGSRSLLQVIEPRFPALQAESLPAEPPGKPKNAGMGSLLLLQQIFPTQESNQGHPYFTDEETEAQRLLANASKFTQARRDQAKIQFQAVRLHRP